MRWRWCLALVAVVLWCCPRPGAAQSSATHGSQPVSLVYQGEGGPQSIDSRASAQKVLQPMYGDQWQNSVAGRTQSRLQSQGGVGDHLRRLAGMRGEPVTVSVRPDETWAHTVGNTDTVVLPDRFRNDHPDLNRYMQTDMYLDGLLAHEVGHTALKTVREEGSYGGDGRHTQYEITAPRTAWGEGWAEYNQSLFDTSTRQRMLNMWRGGFERENKGSTADKPSYSYSRDASFYDRLSNEGTVTRILLGLDDGGRRRDAIFDAVRASNGENTDLFRVLRRYVDDNPNDALRTGAVVDYATGFTGSTGRMVDLLGDHWWPYSRHRDRFAKDFRDPDSRSNSLFESVKAAKESMGIYRPKQRGPVVAQAKPKSPSFLDRMAVTAAKAPIKAMRLLGVGQ